jgi:hypothetical protein
LKFRTRKSQLVKETAPQKTEFFSLLVVIILAIYFTSCNLIKINMVEYFRPMV